ncbi:MAG TPA: hypothetical protein VL135_00445 [Terracidiphilus sp.]|nr:hypothetical protein [Terracidiphilus sp.]
MAATQTLVAGRIENQRPQERAGSISLLATAALTVLAVLIHGYHPYAEDGGIYLPGILRLIHPELYPTWTGFVTAQTRFSLFAPAIASFVRFTGISLMSCIFGVYVLSIWGTLYAAWLLALRCMESQEARYGAISILALCITAPAAGTSLLLIDPYVTARSLSTPLGILALVGTLDFVSDFKRSARMRKSPVALAAVSLLIAAAMHPLMASYAAACVVMLLCASISTALLRSLALAGLGFFTLLVATLINLLAPVPPRGYAEVALSRSYWFLSGWQWYEIAGIVAPLILLWAIGRNTTILNERGRWLARMGLYAGLIGLEISLIFARQSAHNYSVAMLQPLRIFHMIYIVMFLLIGAMLAAVFLDRDRLRWTATFLVFGALMYFVQVETFPHSSHIELPGRSPSNDWEQGFFWIRNSTPLDATFALDAKYIESFGEDAQNFRAIAERSALPDYTKDGGIAAVDPALTPEWLKGEAIQIGLATMSDEQRVAKLAQAQVRWLLLPRSSSTAFVCPYQNRVLRVCQLPAR